MLRDEADEKFKAARFSHLPAFFCLQKAPKTKWSYIMPCLWTSQKGEDSEYF